MPRTQRSAHRPEADGERKNPAEGRKRPLGGGLLDSRRAKGVHPPIPVGRSYPGNLTYCVEGRPSRAPWSLFRCAP